MTQDANGLQRAMSLRAAGVTVVTTQDRHGAPRGLTATAVCSVSLAPPMILVCIDRTAECYEAFQEAEAFAVNLLRHDQEALSYRFAQKERRKFEGIPHRPGLTGSPILTDVLAHMECRIRARYPGGGHTIVLGEVVSTGVAPLEEIWIPPAALPRWLYPPEQPPTGRRLVILKPKAFQCSTVRSFTSARTAERSNRLPLTAPCFLLYSRA